MIGAVEWRGFMLLDPWFLLLVPLVLLAAAWRWWRPCAALPTAAASLFADVPTTWRQRLLAAPLLLKTIAGLCLAVAMARPVERDVLPLREEGIDIVLAVDVSSSMEIPDLSETTRVRRMDAARQRAEQFAAARVHDRVALVAFARYAELRCPPTLDEAALGAFLRVLDIVEPGGAMDGTAVGSALAKSVQVLQKSAARSKVVVLLTDGQNNVADILPTDAAKMAKDAGVRVHTIGLGNGELTPFGLRPIDFGELRAIAETTGGAFFQPKSDGDLAEVYARIDVLEKQQLDDPRYRTTDRFEWPLGLGLVLLLLAIGAEVLLFRRVP